MSVRPESTRSSRASILKTPSIKSRLSVQKSATKVRFKLPSAKKIRDILRSYVRRENVRDFENLVVLVRDSELLDDDIQDLLSEATKCISLLNCELHLFVEALLSLKWANRNAKVTEAYQSFLLNLLSAHNYHAKYAIDKLVSSFIPGVDENEWPDGIVTDEDWNKYSVIHCTFNMMLEVVPMCRELLKQALVNHYPYIKRPTHQHECYLHNLLWILQYIPEFRNDVLHLIFSKLVLLDVNAPREEVEKTECEPVTEDVFDMDDDAKSCKMQLSDRMKHPLAHTLDVCMDKVFMFIESECFEPESEEVNWDTTKRLYHELLTVFDKVILPTYNIHHVQFAMFNLCCYKTAIAEAFLNFLWKKVTTPNVPAVIRQASVSYLASLVARGNFIPLVMLKGTLQQVADWIHLYIGAQDGLEFANSDIRMHTVFYCVCQALFYVIAFRQRDLVNTKKNISFLGSLNLTKIVTCQLNPLKVCLPAIVQNFAAVTRTYQLAYCYTIMEHNARNVIPTIYQTENGSAIMCDGILDSFFPFDPYVLKRSGLKVQPYYLNYQEPIDNDKSLQPQDFREFEDDDFLWQSETSTGLDKFSYGASPGFKLKN